MNTITYLKNTNILKTTDKINANKQSDKGWVVVKGATLAQLADDLVNHSLLFQYNSGLVALPDNRHRLEFTKNKENVNVFTGIMADFDLKDFNIHDDSQIVNNIASPDHLIEHLRAHAAQWPFSSLIFKSVSGGVRVLIPMDSEHPITDPDLYKYLCHELYKHYPHLHMMMDKTAFDLARYFYKGQEGSMIITDKNNLVKLEDLTKQLGTKIPTGYDLGNGTIVDKKVKASKGGVKAGTAKKDADEEDTFSEENTITLADNSEVVINTLDFGAEYPHLKHPIFCPFCIHDAEHRSNFTQANAFISKNEQGHLYIHCSTHKGKGLKSTFWQNSAEAAVKSKTLWFNAQSGCAMTVTQGGLKAFVKNEDWVSYCNENNINPKIKTYLMRCKTVWMPDQEFGVQIVNEEKVFNYFLKTKKQQKMIQTELDLASYNDEFLKVNAPLHFQILENMFMNTDEREYFLNWLATIFQTNKKIPTAIIIGTNPGSGKNLLFERSLRNIFKYVTVLPASQLGKQFNSLELNTRIMCYDEVFQGENKERNLAVKEQLKNKIGSTTLTVELKGIDAIVLDNYTQYVIFTNNFGNSLTIDTKGDRRFTILENRESVDITDQTWFPGPIACEPIIESESFKFAEYLLYRAQDTLKASIPFKNAAREMIQESSKGNTELLVDALKDMLRATNSSLDRMDVILQDLTGNYNDNTITIGMLEHEIKQWSGLLDTTFTLLLKQYYGKFYSPTHRGKIVARGMRRVKHSNKMFPGDPQKYVWCL